MKKVCKVLTACALAIVGFSPVWGQSPAEKAPKTAQPATDSAEQASPVAKPPSEPVADAATEASPGDAHRRAVGIPPHTLIAVRLDAATDSAHTHNGANLHGKLAQAVRLSNGGSIAAGSRVGLTVVSVASAGKIASAGEISVQVTHVGSVGVLSDVITIHGQQGHKDLADSAPAKGSEAMLNAEAEMTFHVPAVPSLPVKEPATQP